MSPPPVNHPPFPGTTHHQFNLPTRSYHYTLTSPPPSSSPSTLLLALHGWPDTHHFLRHQYPTLLSHNLTILAPDLQGYGLSSSPSDLSNYTFKTACDDLALLVAEILPTLSSPTCTSPHPSDSKPLKDSRDLEATTTRRIFVLGHDWGGALAYRFALWHPSLVRGLITICTPYAAPQKTYLTLKQLVSTILPNFKYQLQLASPDVEEYIGSDPIRIRQFLNAVYGGKVAGTKDEAFNTRDGIILRDLAKVGETRLLTKEEMDYYVSLYARNGVRGALNWYRTRQLNWEDEMVLVREERCDIKCPTLFVRASRDEALPEAMARGMERWFTGGGLEVRVVEAGHWALWQRRGECCGILAGWLEGQLGGGAGGGKDAKL